MKLIIDIPKERLDSIKHFGIKQNEVSMLERALISGTPLDSNDSDYAEAQAYFDGQAYGWEQGRKALINDLKAEIEQIYQGIDTVSHNEYENAVEQGKEIAYENVLSFLDNIGKAESEESK